MMKINRQFPLAALLILLPCSTQGQTLEDTFRDPPDSTRPWCYWYWINDNISKEGITKDLEAMSRVGIGTALIGNNWFKEQPMGKVPLLSEKWWDLTVYAVKEGRRMGVDIGFFNCPGWSQSGGPWVKPAQSMRYLRSCETRVTGPADFSGVLPAPGEDFQDVAVLAFPAPVGETEPLDSRSPQISVEPRIAGAGVLLDGNIETAIALPSGEQNMPLRLDIEVDASFTARSVVLTPGPGAFRMQVEVQARIEGSFQTIRSFKYDRRNPRIIVGPMVQGPVVASLPATTSDHFRLIFSPRQGSGQLAEIEISPAARVELVVEKQLGKMHPTPTPLWGDYLWEKTPEPDNESFVVDPARVIDLTQHLDGKGRIEWKVPEGEWILQRIGMLPTGTINSPAAPHAEGPEVDKMNRQYLVAHFDAFVGKLLRRLSLEDRRAFKYVVSDSYEVGPQNWTDDMRQSFEETYGYDPLLFLAVLSGRIVRSAEASDRFLWDLRRLVADRVAEDYVGGLRDLCAENNLQLWLENYGHWGFPGEFMRYGGASDLISGEFWVTGTLGNIECRAAASTAHAYGKRVVYAEAFTSGSNWVYTPYDLKARGDWAFTEGINHFVLHVYIHQPSDDFVPGMNAWFGTEFNRHNTWFEEGKDWIDYLQRCHVMLQHGVHVCDFAYYIGEDTPIMTGVRQPEQPTGYDFDYINAEVLLDRMEMRNGLWTLPDGKTYKVLVLPPLQSMRPTVLRRLRDLVEAGGVLYGEAPLQSPSLQHWPRCDDQIKRIAHEMWQGLQRGEVGQRSFGKGRIFQGENLERVVRQLSLTSDVSTTHPKEVLWTHREAPGMDLYFLSNQTMKTIELAPVFRSAKRRVPELWHADTGEIETIGRYQTVEEGTSIPLTLGPAGSVFVVFRHKRETMAPHVTGIQGLGKVRITAGGTGWKATFEQGGEYTLQREEAAPLMLTVKDPPPPILLEGPWQLSFLPGRDTPPVITLNSPEFWTLQKDEAIRHYSGTATYRTDFQMPPEHLLASDLKFELDLGRVEPMVRVILNGANLGLLWKPHFRIEVTDSLRPGENVLELAVTNLWSNRLVGERKFPEGFPGRVRNQQFRAQSSLPRTLSSDRPLQPSGMNGPVTIKSFRQVELAHPAS